MYEKGALKRNDPNHADPLEEKKYGFGSFVVE